MDSLKTGKFISELRKEKGLTQSQLADMLKVSDKAVSRWETGRGFPDIGSLEDISDVLCVSVVELLHGERLEENITREEVDDISEVSVGFFKSEIKRKKYLSLAGGFIIGFVIILTLFIHLFTPVYQPYSEKFVETEKTDGRLFVILEDVSGYEAETVKGEDGKTEYFISAYRTKGDILTGSGKQYVVVLKTDGTEGAPDRVFYYPNGDDSDKLLYGEEISGGVVSLPRLVYNYWIILGALATLVAFAVYFILRNKKYSGKLLVLSGVPLAFTLSVIISTCGGGGIYNPAYFLCGIILLSVLLSVLFGLLVQIFLSGKKKKS